MQRRHGLFRLLGLAILVSSVSACPRPDGLPAGAGDQRAPEQVSPAGTRLTYARRMTDADVAARLPGPMTAGRAGDWLIGNEKVVFVISDVDSARGFAVSGGHVIDADRLEGGGDALVEMFPYLADSFPRQAVNEKIEVVSPGGGEPASIQVVGADSDAPALRITTRYRIHPGRDYLIIQSRVDNTGPERITDYKVGDAIQWGRTEARGPGVGSAIPGTRDLGLSWLAGIGTDVSYGYVHARNRIDGPNGSSWSDPVVASLDMAPGKSATYTRYLVVGTGDLASVLEPMLAIRGETVGILTGQVTDDTGAAVSGALVTVDRGGRYRIALPPDIYQVSFSAPGRAPTKPVDTGVAARERKTLLGKLGPPSAMRVESWEGDARVPVKITVDGVDGTPTPSFGLKFSADGAGNTVYSPFGDVTIPLAPGKYRVTLSRGIEYRLVERTVQVKVGRTAQFIGKMLREVDTNGWVAADFHQHSTLSPDAGVSPRDVVIASMAEGLELLAITDHNVVADFGPTLKELGVAKQFRVVAGNEITPTSNWGHFNAFPMPFGTDGAPPVRDLDPGELLKAMRDAPGGERVIQVNHPRAGSIGYFDIVGLDPDTGEPTKDGWSPDFDAVEVATGKFVANAEESIADWFNLLSRGQIYTATGNSDAHTLLGTERGYPRTYIPSKHRNPGDITDAEVVKALRSDRRAIVTNGPFVEMWVGRKPIGSMVSAPKGRPLEIRVKVQAARWIDLEKVDLVVNGDVVDSVRLSGAKRALRYDGRLTIKPDRDSWVVAVVRGAGGLEPVVTPYRGQSIPPMALTNPIWIDVDGNGRYDPESVETKEE